MGITGRNRVRDAGERMIEPQIIFTHDCIAGKVFKIWASQNSDSPPPPDTLNTVYCKICGGLMGQFSDDELKRAILLILEHTHNLTEGAGAASLAGLIKNKEIFKGKKVVCVLTGGNLQMDVLKDIINNSK